MIDFNADIILVPVHKHCHWYLIIIENEVAAVLDSLHADLNHVKKTLKAIWQEREHIIEVRNCPKQTNSWSCGLYTMLFAYRHLLKQPFDDISTKELIDFRTYVAEIILKKERFNRFCSLCFVVLKRIVKKCINCNMPYCAVCKTNLLKGYCFQCSEF